MSFASWVSHTFFRYHTFGKIRHNLWQKRSWLPGIWPNNPDNTNILRNTESLCIPYSLFSGAGLWYPDCRDLNSQPIGLCLQLQFSVPAFVRRVPSSISTSFKRNKTIVVHVVFNLVVGAGRDFNSSIPISFCTSRNGKAHPSPVLTTPLIHLPLSIRRIHWPIPDNRIRSH